MRLLVGSEALVCGSAIGGQRGKDGAGAKGLAAETGGAVVPARDRARVR